MTPIPTLADLMRRVKKTRTCWLWQGAIRHDGYGRTRAHNRYLMAHRRIYELLVGPIPDGLVADHVCEVRRCVRPHPKHVVMGTQHDNLLGMRRRMKTCRKGLHPRTPENIFVCTTPKHGKTPGLMCRPCRNALKRKYWQRDKDAINAARRVYRPAEPAS